MTAVSGDIALIGTLRGWGIGPVLAATVADGTITTASTGARLSADVEIGSVSKGVTGLLYEDAIDRGEVERTTRLGDLLPALAGSPAAAVTLDALATHSSGLPRLPRGMQAGRRTLALALTGRNPYGDTLEQLLEQTRANPVARRPRPAYSNLGFELLGHAVAAAAGTTYTALLRTRLAQPLGLTSLYAPRTTADLRPTALRGTSRGGRRREPWVGEAVAPAGGIRADVGDVARLALALLDGTAPGCRALDARTDFAGSARIGAGWITSPPAPPSLAARGEATLTWHNGATGGFRSFVGLDRRHGTAVVVVSPRSVSVDARAAQLLEDLAP